jgi:hypothetical protein
MFYDPPGIEFCVCCVVWVKFCFLMDDNQFFPDYMLKIQSFPECSLGPHFFFFFFMDYFSEQFEIYTLWEDSAIYPVSSLAINILH